MKSCFVLSGTSRKQAEEITQAGKGDKAWGKVGIQGAVHLRRVRTLGWMFTPAAVASTPRALVLMTHGL